ncbi:ATP-dependent Clp protease proteolytic subunit 2 [Clostridia bacterium]|nr:ATP-dependent Clp protease proteolytic subunit 2 [Clostridia bacterium]
MQNQQGTLYYRATSEPHDTFLELDTLVAEKGIFWIDKVVDESVVRQLVNYLILRTSQYPGEPIYIYINSPGGHVSDGLAIYDAIREAQNTGCEVYTVATGMAASMGAFLLAAGTKGCRYATPNCEILLHQPLGGASGQATDMVIAIENIVKTKARLTQHLAAFTGQPANELAPKLERDFIMSGKEALEEGVIDHIGYPHI